MKPLIIRSFLGAIFLWLLFLMGTWIYPNQNLGMVWQNGTYIQTSLCKSTGEGELHINMDLKRQMQELERSTAEINRILEGTLINHPSQDYEGIQRQQELDLKELWYSLRRYADKFEKQDFQQIQDIYRLLRSYPARIRQMDGFKTYREREMAELSRIVQKRLHDLQNPKDCSKAKKVVLAMRRECGFGCQIHHVMYCLLMGYATGRTLILESREGWEKVFLPISETCTRSTVGSWVDWGSGNDDTQELVLPTEYVKPVPAYVPVAIPLDIAERLEKVHDEPQIWWVGQFVKYLLRLQPRTQAWVDEAKNKMNFSSPSPTVGIHVRRTDKISSGEASFHSLKEYMSHVEEYFAIREKLEGPLKRRVFVASDDPNVIKEAVKNYTEQGWEVIGDRFEAQSASVVDRRHSKTALVGVLKDILLLSECDYLVCTLSSNLCRLAYELMQTRHADASNRLVSLDNVYHFATGSEGIQTARFGHKPRNEGELELRVGDEIGDGIEMGGNRWDGMSKGTNHRTNKTGLFPSYKARNTYVKVNFPKRKWWTKSGEV